MTPPEHLNDIAKAEWEFISAHLDLANTDKTSLELYCTAYARWREAEEKCKTFGEVILSPNKNYPQVSPYFVVCNQAFEHVRKMLAEFGLTPAARQRMSIGDGAGEERDEQWWESAKCGA